jgi:probable addiction module antidote protein
MTDAMDMDARIEPWDPAAYVRDDDDAAGLLAAALETGELRDITFALATIARARGVTETARGAGLARGTLNKAIRAGANPTLSTFLAVLDALDVQLTAKPKAAG